MRYLLLALTLVACRAKHHAGPPMTLAKDVAPPETGVKLGMTVDEAKKANAAVADDDLAGGLELGGNDGYHVHFFVGFDGHVDGISLHLPTAQHCADEPTRAWGAPTGEHRDFPTSKPRPMWSGASWEAWLDFDSAVCELNFEPNGKNEKDLRKLREVGAPL